ncbi:hypothetical protein DPMN_184194 [Dreissena polymorpha]|uniref:Uncharacterized protein n=1 Tax=Dreissena polymorpha TaxID=45954 RepID=A0A9D4DIS6_DREPO|nr:hypothetical protein DPMN_184194 [Dreissena polymorpha]
MTAFFLVHIPLVSNDALIFQDEFAKAGHVCNTFSSFPVADGALDFFTTQICASNNKVRLAAMRKVTDENNCHASVSAVTKLNSREYIKL